jgi:hypothetical protein
MSVDRHSPEDEIATLAIAASNLVGLMARIGTAAPDEMPTLAAEAKTSVEHIIRCCADLTSLAELTPDRTQTARNNLYHLAKTLQDQIASIFAHRLLQPRDGMSQTKH